MNVVLLWHMHQPYYVNPLTKMAMMPWVRLHAAKGYADMLEVLDAAPQIRANFNFSPVLVQQILELAEGRVTDLWETWARCPASELQPDQKRHLLENFFKINWDTGVKPHPRYQELLNLRGHHWSSRSIDEAIKLFTEADFRDLQTWHNLSWCGFAARKRHPILGELIKQDRDFSEEQKCAVLNIHREMLREVLGLYRRAMEEGRIELTTTPYFHPIMPLVYDTDFARRCMPRADLPMRFAAPEDVRAQLQLAQDQHEIVFGARATGLWPSEGSMAPEVIPLLREAGFEYFCTDEGNLFRSLEQDPAWRDRHADHLELFQGWRIRHEDYEINALFRERPLSDFIGFNAARNEAHKSTEYLLGHLDHLQTVTHERHGVVLLALDGENAWEAFHDGGEAFLTRFYQGLESRHNLRTLKLRDYFTEFPPVAETLHLHTGSWINSDFDIWIGDPEENKAWEWLGQTRKFLVDTAHSGDIPPDKLAAAWAEIYAAEGSDWFWWYGPDFSVDSDFLFDELFRTHLQNVYRLLDCEPPAHFEVPICLPSDAVSYAMPHARISPPLTGRPGNYYDWIGAGHLNILRQQTAMFHSDRIGEQLYFGFDQRLFYLRLDCRRRPEALVIQFTSPLTVRVTVGRNGDKPEVEISADQVHYERAKADIPVVWDQFLILAIPTETLGWSNPGQVSFFVQVLEREMQRERYPERGAIEFPVPQPDFESRQWFV